ncbi:MAG TPA: hypothetical protein VFV46_02380 [Lacibacter sp.]|nr:hypothetical protein [Lacibacter sp.]
MKQFVLILTAFMISLGVAAQGKSGTKGKGKDKQNKEQSVDANSNSKGKNNNDAKGNKEQKEHDQKVWEGTYKNEGDGPKPSKNQPAKVREAFSRDYPNVQNVTWSKYRGDWTATFRNGVFTSTAVYHANGDRRDTRTPVPRQEVPRNILEEIFKRRPQTQQNEEVIKVELPEKNRHLFRFKEIINGVANYFFVDNAGKEVNYNY